MKKLYWEDFTPTIGGDNKTGEEKIGSIKVGREQMIAFAQSYDPQPFHLDEELAKNTFLGALCASGWQVTTLFSRVLYESYEKNTALVGAAHIDECRWMKPVFPGDELHCTRECLETKDLNETSGQCRFRWKFFDGAGTQKTEITGWSTILKTPNDLV